MTAQANPKAYANAYPLNEVSFHTIDLANPSNGWKQLQNALAESGRELSDWAIRLLRSGLDGTVRCIAYEPFYVCKDHADLHSHFYSKKFASQGPHVGRLHFFNRAELDKEVLIRSPTDYEREYIGYSVIRPVAHQNIGRTIIDPSKIRRGGVNGFYVLKTRYSTRIFGSELSVSGFPYTSQDSDATLCGHSALWSICRYLSQRYPQYGELLPYDLIAMTHQRQGRVVPHRGMSYEDYSTILTEFGTHPVIIQAKQSLREASLLAAAFKDICTYIESGVPILASVGGHAVAVIGHTLDFTNTAELQDGWFIDHSSFFDSFIINDDNQFPYSKLTNNPYPQEQQTVVEGVAKNRFFIQDVNAAVCPLPEKVFLTAARARNICARALNLKREEIERLGEAPFVTRLFFTSSAAFKKRKIDTLSGKAQLEGAPLFVAQLHLPHFIWVLEVAPFVDYRNGTCCGEFVLDATAGSLDNALIYSLVGRELEYANRRITFASSPERYSQFTHNLGEN